MARWLAAALSLLVATSGLARAADGPPGVSSCSGCHASKSVRSPVPSLSGRTAPEIAGIMLEFKSGARPGTVMGRIAKGFADRDIDAMAEWLAKQGN
jgi:sulfide dehydrogenase cytochrome subunit